VGEVEAAFALACVRAGEALGEPTACRYFFNWYDDADRPTMRRELLGEVNLALADREAVAAFGVTVAADADSLPDPQSPPVPHRWVIHAH
jgi:hypothetical protein